MLEFPSPLPSVGKIVFGCWAIGGWHWGKTDDDQSIAAIHAALEHGISSFAAAPVYGFGRSEEVLGRALAGKRNLAFIATKAGLRWDDSSGKKFFDTRFEGRNYEVFRNLRESSILLECETSLRRLKTDRIDLYQIHWPDPTCPMEEAARAFEKLIVQGKIRFAGVSNFTVQMMVDWKKISGVPLLFDQERYSLLDRKIEKNNLPYCAKNKIGLLAYEPLAQGLLTGKMDGSRVFSEGDARVHRPEFEKSRLESLNQLLASLRPLCEKYSCTIASLAIAWVLSHRGVAGAICGIRTPEQAEENARASLLRPEIPDLETLSKRLNVKTKD